MKSERRHELQHNLLLDWLMKSSEKVKPYQNIILGAVAAVVVILLIYTVWSKQSASKAAQAWDDLDAVIETGGSPSKLTKVAEDNPNTTVADFATVVLADSRLAKGCNDLFENKATAMQELSKAIEAYETVHRESSLPALKERAAFGMARARESRGELEKAEKLYAEVVESWPNGTYTAAAVMRMADLKRPGTRTMYDHLKQFDPKPATSEASGEGPAKFDLNSLPSDGPDSSPNDPLNDINFENTKKDAAKKPEAKTEPKPEKKPDDAK